MDKQELIDRIERHNKEKLNECNDIMRNIRQVYRLTGKALDLKLPDRIISYYSKEDVIMVSMNGHTTIWEGLELVNMLPDYKSDIERELDNILHNYIMKNGVK